MISERYQNFNKMLTQLHFLLNDLANLTEAGWTDMLILFKKLASFYCNVAFKIRKRFGAYQDIRTSKIIDDM